MFVDSFALEMLSLIQLSKHVIIKFFVYLLEKIWVRWLALNGAGMY